MRFVVRNSGDQTATVFLDAMGCGCSLGALGTNVLGPGCETSLDAALPLRGRQGPVTKRFAIRSQIPEPQLLLLGFQGLVDIPATATPARILFGALSPSSLAAEYDCALRFSAAVPDRLLGVTIDSPWYTSRWMEVRRNCDYRLVVGTVPSNLPLSGACNATIFVHTARRGTNAMTIPVEGRVYPSDLIVRPDVLKVPLSCEPGAALYAMLEYRGAGTLSVLDASVERAGVEVRALQMPRNRWRIDIHGVTNANGITGAVLRIRTNLQDHETIAIPFEAADSTIPSGR